LSAVDSGVKGENVLTMEVPRDFGGTGDVAASGQYEQMRNELAALPGVSQVATDRPCRSASAASCSTSKPRGER
jgi:hypothetical protein